MAYLFYIKIRVNTCTIGTVPVPRYLQYIDNFLFAAQQLIITYVLRYIYSIAS